MDGASFSVLQPMPLSVSGGCAAILDSERMFFAGGLTDVPQGEFIDFSLIYDKRTNQVEANFFTGRQY